MTVHWNENTLSVHTPCGVERRPRTGHVEATRNRDAVTCKRCLSFLHEERTETTTERNPMTKINQAIEIELIGPSGGIRYVVTGSVNPDRGTVNVNMTTDGSGTGQALSNIQSRSGTVPTVAFDGWQKQLLHYVCGGIYELGDVRVSA